MRAVELAAIEDHTGTRRGVARAHIGEGAADDQSVCDHTRRRWSNGVPRTASQRTLRRTVSSKPDASSATISTPAVRSSDFAIERFSQSLPGFVLSRLI